METIQMLWIGNKLSKIEKLSIKSFLENGHKVHLYCYDDVRNIPFGTKTMDANKIVSKDKIFRAHGGSYGAFSDLFRHELLYNLGGCWVDTDVICLKPFVFDDEVALCGEEFDKISAGILKLPKENILSEKIIENFREPWKFIKGADEMYINKLKKKYHKNYFKELYKYTHWGELGGPIALTKLYSELELEWDILVPETFYPVHWRDWWAIFYDTQLSSKINWDDCYGIHLWNNMFSSYYNFNKENTFEKGTIISDLFEKYKI